MTTTDYALRRPTDLQDHYWPPVHEFARLGTRLAAFIALSPLEQADFLVRARFDRETHAAMIHDCLADIYAYHFGYRDGACTARTDDELEAKLLGAKLLLERELLDSWLDPAPVPHGVVTQEDAASYLAALAATNLGASHELFDFLATRASRRAIDTLLRCELIRNEVVDDEVAMLVVGLQGQLKATVSSNLWDECGHGRLQHFHTFWLRRLLDHNDDWQEIADYRASALPWFARITSNVNAMLLSRPAHKLMAYGCFLAFESWVEPHFRRILAGMRRVGLHDAEARVYFTSHVTIDPFHSRQLIDGLRAQCPALTPDEVTQVVRGAHLGVAAGVAQFDRMLPYLRSLS
jgi:hypothetical protein